MNDFCFPSIDMVATGRRIAQLRKQSGLSVKEMQTRLGFEAPQAIYKWQSGASLPSLDNLLALSWLLKVPMDSILVTSQAEAPVLNTDEPEGSFFMSKKEPIIFKTINILFFHLYIIYII